MKVCFVNPSVAWDSLDATWIRHGIAQLSACLKSRHETTLIDTRPMAVGAEIDWVAFDSAVHACGAEAYCVSVLSVNFDHAKEAIRRIRKMQPEAKIIAGGIHVSVETRACSQLGADVLVTGEGETVLPEILDDWAGTPAVMQGIPPDLDSLPYADRELFRGFREEPIGRLPAPFHTIIIGRGCPHRCTFCQPAEKTHFGPAVRMRGLDHVFSELHELQDRYGLASFLIHDDCFSAFQVYAARFADRLMEEFQGVEFYCQARADHVVRNPGLFALLRDVGLRGCLVGFESGSNRVLEYLHKDTTLETNLRAARILADLGITIWANLMVGIPTETREEAMETFAMAVQLKRIQPEALLSWAMYTPHPGTTLYEQCSGLSLVQSADDFHRYFDGGKPKIVGPDYEFLSKMVALTSMEEVVRGI